MNPIMEFRDYLNIFRRRAWVIALVVVLAVGGVVVAFGGRAPQYQAEVSLLVTPQVIAPTALDDTGLSTIQSAYRETVLNNIIQVLRSRTIYERVAAQVGGMSPGQVRASVTVKDIRGTDFLTISATDAQPARAARIVNAMSQELLAFYAEINRAGATTARQFIAQQLSLAQTRLSTAEQSLSAYQTRTGTVALNDEVTRTVQRILDLQTQYDTATLDNRIAQTRVAAIQSKLQSQNDTRFASMSILTNPVITQIRDHLTTLELELASLRQLYTDQHPKVQVLLGRIAEDRQRMSAEAANVLSGKSLGTSPIREQFFREMINGEVDVVTTRARAAGIQPILGKMQARLNTVPKEQLVLAGLQRDVKIAEQLFTRLSTVHQEAVIRENKAGTAGQAAIVVVDPALVPSMPVSKQLPRMVSLAALMALFVGAALALAVESLDDRIRSAPQAEGAYGVPVLAAIPTMNFRTHRHLTTVPATVTSLLFPAIFVLLVLGMATGLYVVRAGSVSADLGHVSQALLQAVQNIR